MQGRCFLPRRLAPTGRGSVWASQQASRETSYPKRSQKRWHPINEPIIWQGSEGEALQEDAPTQRLSPAWKVILLSDGSVTRHLKLMTGLDVKVDCMEMQELGDDASGLPAGAEKIKGPRLRRQVFLRTPASAEGNGSHSKKLVYAASWWNAEQAKTCLANEEQPIWTSLLGSELRREIQSVYHGNSEYLEAQFEEKGPFWGRQYVFYRDGGKPLTVIYEVFSPSLRLYLGGLGS